MPFAIKELQNMNLLSFRNLFKERRKVQLNMRVAHCLQVQNRTGRNVGVVVAQIPGDWKPFESIGLPSAPCEVQNSGFEIFSYRCLGIGSNRQRPVKTAGVEERSESASGASVENCVFVACHR